MRHAELLSDLLHGALLDVHRLDDAAHAGGEREHRGFEHPPALALLGGLFGQVEFARHLLHGGLVERGDRAGGICERFGDDGFRHAHRCRDLYGAGGPAECGGEGVADGHRLFDAFPDATGGPVHRAHLVGERAEDAPAGVCPERHTQVRIEGVRRLDQGEGPHGGEILLGEVGGSGMDIRGQVSD